MWATNLFQASNTCISWQVRSSLCEPGFLERIIFRFSAFFFGFVCCHQRRISSLPEKKKHGVFIPLGSKPLHSQHRIFTKLEKLKLSKQTKQVVCDMYAQVRLMQPGLCVVQAIHSVSQLARIRMLLFQYTTSALCKNTSHVDGGAQFSAPEELTNQCMPSKRSADKIPVWTVQSWMVLFPVVPSSPVKAFARVYKQMKRGDRYVNTPACSVIVVQHPQTRRSCEETECSICGLSR